MGLLNPWWDWCSRMFKNQMQFSGSVCLFPRSQLLPLVRIPVWIWREFPILRRESRLG